MPEGENTPENTPLDETALDWLNHLVTLARTLDDADQVDVLAVARGLA